MDARILLRDAVPAVVERHFLTGGKRKIPLIVFLDQHYAEVGRWIERPAVAEELFRRHAPGDPALRQALGALLDSGAFQRAVLDEWRAVLGG